MRAVMLAAGVGKRLGPELNHAPKLLLSLGGKTLLRRHLEILEQVGIAELVLVTGYRAEAIEAELAVIGSPVAVTTVHNPDYTEGSVVSLWCARDAISRPFLLLECDLVFDADLLSGMLRPDRIAVARRAGWMSGTTVTLDTSRRVRRFHLPPGAVLHAAAHKTVNIYSLSLPTWHRVVSRLSSLVAAGHVHDYYEAVFRDMTADGSLHLQAVPFDRGRWYEIDTREDVRLAEQVFAPSGVALDEPPPGVRPSPLDV